MSFSFNVRAATLAMALVMVADEMAKVVQSQPSHAIDEAPVKATVQAYGELLAVDESKDVQVSVHGSISWTGPWGDGHRVVGSSVGVSVYQVDREAPAAT